ncbi:MAG: hypothetical protein JF596_21225, partial [Stenotrophomonas sp.]|nr:hypothetical protein [Stenotrophomonas sp.]
MTGSRYVDWTHVHVNGDRDRAAAYVGLGRKVLGAVTEDAQRWGLQTHVMHHKTEDGAEIIGEIRGGIPRITITPPPLIEGEPPPIRGKDDFIVWARDASRPEGIDAVHPKQILRPSWLTFFFDEDVAGYAEFQG